jgi:hypothetical protein
VNLTDDANNRRDVVYESSSEAVKIYCEFREFREKCVYVCYGFVRISGPARYRFPNRSFNHGP